MAGLSTYFQKTHALYSQRHTRKIIIFVVVVVVVVNYYNIFIIVGSRVFELLL